MGHVQTLARTPPHALSRPSRPPGRVETDKGSDGDQPGRIVGEACERQGLSGVRALRSGALEICIKPANG